MDKLQLREEEIFNTLKDLKVDFVLIGGYATNSYAWPRFSVDCDIVIRNKDLEQTKEILNKLGYELAKNHEEVPYEGKFLRMEKKIEENIKASVDILIDQVHDRQTNVSFDTDWIFENSKKRTITGKTITERIETRIINAEALFVMKFISARTTDIRDIFMMVNNIKDFEWVRKEIGNRIDFDAQSRKIKENIEEKQFKDNLQGVYGYIDEKIFEKYIKEMLKIIMAKT